MSYSSKANVSTHFATKAKYAKLVYRLVKKHRGFILNNMVSRHITSLNENDNIFWAIGFDTVSQMNLFGQDLACEMNRLKTGIKEKDSRPGFFKKWWRRILSSFSRTK